MRPSGQGLPYRDRPLRLHRAARRARGAARLPAARHRLRRDGNKLLPRPRDPDPEPAFQARQVAPRLVHLALPLGLGHQDFLPYPAEPRYRTGQPDPGLRSPDARNDAKNDTRPAARPVEYAP